MIVRTATGRGNSMIDINVKPVEALEK